MNHKATISTEEIWINNGEPLGKIIFKLRGGGLGNHAHSFLSYQILSYTRADSKKDGLLYTVPAKL